MEQIPYKTLVHGWCAKKGIQPNYDTCSEGPPHCKVFKTELKIDSYGYVGKGESNSKKDAEKKASKDYVRYLLRNKIMHPNEIPNWDSMYTENLGLLKESEQESPMCAFTQAISKSPSLAFQAAGQLKSSPKGDDQISSPFVVTRDEFSIKNEVMSDDDLTVDNAKSLLNYFVQANSIPLKYVYNYISDHNGGSYSAESSVALPAENRTVSGKGLGKSKQDASKKCALAIMRQLYCLGVVFIPRTKIPNISASNTTSQESNKNFSALLNNIATPTKVKDSCSNNVLLDFGRTSKAYHSVEFPETGDSSLSSSNLSWNPWSPTSNICDLKNAVSVQDIESSLKSTNTSSPITKEDQEVSLNQIDMKDLKQCFSLFQNNLTLKHSNGPPGLLKASNSVDCDITKIDFNVYQDMFKKLGNYNEFDVFGYYIATILKWLPKDQAMDLQSALTAVIKAKTSSDLLKTTTFPSSPEIPHSDCQNALKDSFEQVNDESEEMLSSESNLLLDGGNENLQSKKERKKTNESMDIEKKLFIINEFKRFKTEKREDQTISELTVDSISGIQLDESPLIDL